MSRPFGLGLVRWHAGYSRQAGVTTISLAMARAWRRLGCDVVWIGPPPPEAAGITCLATAPTTEALAAGAIAAAARRGLGLLVSFEPFTEGPAVARARAATGLPHAHFGMHTLASPAGAAEEAETYASADLVVSQCRWFQESYLAERFGREFVEGKRRLALPFGVDTRFYGPAAGPPAGPPLVAFVGRLNRENAPEPEYDKGARYLVEAWPAVLARHPQARLALGGDGEQLPELRQLAYELEIAASLDFLGALAGPQQTLALLQRASIFALPSVVDVFPVALLEAMAVGLPVVASAVCGIPECVGPTCGLLVEPRRPDQLAEAITRLLADAPLRARLGQAARRQAVAAYDWQPAAAHILAAFRDLVGGRFGAILRDAPPGVGCGRALDDPLGPDLPERPRLPQRPRAVEQAIAHSVGPLSDRRVEAACALICQAVQSVC